MGKAKKLENRAEKSPLATNVSTLSDTMQGMTEYEEETVERVLADLNRFDENLVMKSRVAQATGMTRLELYGEWAGAENCPKLQGLCKATAAFLRPNQVSEEGKSREEIVRALVGRLENKENAQNRLTQPVE